MSLNGGQNAEQHSIVRKLIDYIPLFMFVGFGGMLVQKVNSNYDEFRRFMELSDKRLVVLEAQASNHAIAMKELSTLMAGISTQLVENSRRWERLQDFLGKPRP